MTVTIRYFSLLKRVTGIDTEQVTLDPAATVGAVVEEAIRLHDGLRPHAGSLLLARNREWAAPDTPVEDGDEIALMPPVSGG